MTDYYQIDPQNQQQQHPLLPDNNAYNPQPGVHSHPVGYQDYQRQVLPSATKMPHVDQSLIINNNLLKAKVTNFTAFYVILWILLVLLILAIMANVVVMIDLIVTASEGRINPCYGIDLFIVLSISFLIFLGFNAFITCSAIKAYKIKSEKNTGWLKIAFGVFAFYYWYLLTSAVYF